MLAGGVGSECWSVGAGHVGQRPQEVKKVEARGEGAVQSESELCVSCQTQQSSLELFDTSLVKLSFF